MINKNEGLKRILIGLFVMVLLVLMSIFERHKTDWLDISLWVAPFLFIAVVIFIDKIKKRKRKGPGDGL